MTAPDTATEPPPDAVLKLTRHPPRGSRKIMTSEAQPRHRRARGIWQEYWAAPAASAWLRQKKPAKSASPVFGLRVARITRNIAHR